MEVTLLHVAGCPNLTVARDRLTEAAELTGGVVRFEEQMVRDHAEAAVLGFTGSPTILIAGTDPFAPDDTTPSVACRLYRTDAGLQGAPSVADVVTVLRHEIGF